MKLQHKNGYRNAIGGKFDLGELRRLKLTFSCDSNMHWILYSYFMPVCSIVKTITPRCRGRPDALLHEAEGQVQ